jgi:(p)ppGpp synthase/HD superfamily hydrolase
MADAPVERARAFALEAYGSERELEHPLEVARLVESAGLSNEAVEAAVLHDLIEDTDVGLDEIDASFGPHVAELVAAMTEDESIRDYEERKREHRERACRAGPEAATIFVADKLSNARRMRTARKQPKAKKLAHYGATLDLMRSAHPDLALLGDLERELDAIRAELQRSPA